MMKKRSYRIDWKKLVEMEVRDYLKRRRRRFDTIPLGPVCEDILRCTCAVSGLTLRQMTERRPTPEIIFWRKVFVWICFGLGKKARYISGLVNRDPRTLYDWKRNVAVMIEAGGSSGRKVKKSVVDVCAELGIDPGRLYICR